MEARYPHSPGEKIMYQEAPYPEALVGLVAQLRVLGMPKMSFELEEMVRFHSWGLALIITIEYEDMYQPGREFRSRRIFDVPASWLSEKQWKRWLFDQVHGVMIHELREGFILEHEGGTLERPFAPSHKPGIDQYCLPDGD
jgi:hypothetical protein